MKKPVLVIMAAGMGSRYGGLKQIDPVDPEGHIIMDFSLYDAKKAGFEEVIFIIKKENHESFLCIPGTDQSSGRLPCTGRQSKTMGNRSCSAELSGNSGCTVCSYQCG